MKSTLFRPEGRTVRALWAWALLGVVAPSAHGLIWGLKTHGPVSGPPAMLFWLDETTNAWGQVAPVTVSGGQVDADGLARDTRGRLFAWRVEAAGSTLLQLDPATAVGTPVGPRLDGLQVRGAAFTLAGRLWVLEDSQSVVLEIDPATGQPLGAPVRVGGLEPGGAFQTGDLSQDRDGSLLLALGGQVSRLDPATGRRIHLYNDVTDLGDGLPPWSVGLAVSPEQPQDDALYLLDVSHHDGLYRYASSSDFTRSLLVDNVVPSYNAGRGDLAALPAGRAEITAIRVQEGLAELDAWCREGLWAWVEHAPEWPAGPWEEVSGSLREVPQVEPGMAAFQTWTGLPAPGERGFWRVVTSREDPR